MATKGAKLSCSEFVRTHARVRDDVRELLHDGHPTACVGDAAFVYVNAFTAHVNVGFFLESMQPNYALQRTVMQSGAAERNRQAS
jgi:hypothetical protein